MFIWRLSARKKSTIFCWYWITHLLNVWAHEKKRFKLHLIDCDSVQSIDERIWCRLHTFRVNQLKLRLKPLFLVGPHIYRKIHARYRSVILGLLEYFSCSNILDIFFMFCSHKWHFRHLRCLIEPPTKCYFFIYHKCLFILQFYCVMKKMYVYYTFTNVFFFCSFLWAILNCLDYEVCLWVNGQEDLIYKN